MSKPRHFATLKVVIEESGKRYNRYIRIFQNNLKRGYEYSFSIDRLTTDPARKLEIFKVINKEIGQYFPNGAIPDKDEKFRFYAASPTSWRENQLGSKLEQILTKEFANAQSVSTSTPAQPISGVSESTLPKSGVRINTDGRDVRLSVGLSTPTCDTNKFRKDVITLLQVLSYVERDSMNAVEHFYSTEFTFKISDSGINNFGIDRIKADLDDTLSNPGFSIAAGKYWCFKEGDYFFVKSSGVILRIRKVDTYKLYFEFVADGQTPKQTKVDFDSDRDIFLRGISEGNFISFNIILEGDTFYVNTEKGRFEQKVTKVDGIEISSEAYDISGGGKSNSAKLSESSFKQVLWENGYKRVFPDVAPVVMEKEGFYLDQLGVVIKITNRFDLPGVNEVVFAYYEQRPDGSYDSVSASLKKDEFQKRLDDGSIKPLYLPQTSENLFNVEVNDRFSKYTGNLKDEWVVLRRYNESPSGKKPGVFTMVEFEMTSERLNGNTFVDKIKFNNTDFTYGLWSRAFRKVVTLDFSQPTTEKASLTDIPASDEELKIEQLNKDIAQLMFFRSILSPIDFEKKIDFSQQIQAKQKEVNALNFHILEKKLKSQNIFEELFEQSFSPLKNAYDGVYAKSPDETDFFAPDGSKSDLSDALNELIRTPQFKDWFGDWELAYIYRDTDAIEIECSKVLNKHYEPLVVWHGTGQEFSYFRFDKFPAAYFAVNQQYSQFFADLHGGDEGFVIPFFLNIRNPLDLTHFETNDVSVKDFFDYIFLQTGLDMDDLGVNPLFLDPSVKPMQTWIYIRNNPNMLQKLAELNMYDGIHFYETNPNIKDTSSPAYKTEAFITFNPNQSKIADPNRGLILLASMKSFLLEKGGKI